MSFHMQPAQAPYGGYFNGVDRIPATDQTFPIGTPVTWDTAAQDLNEHALVAVVTNILGVSLEGVVAGAANNPSGLVGLALAGRENVFMAKLTNGAGVVQTPDAANVNLTYGLLKNGAGSDAWFSVDEADTVNVVVEVIGYSLEIDDGVVFFKFIESAIQQP